MVLNKESPFLRLLLWSTKLGSVYEMSRYGFPLFEVRDWSLSLVWAVQLLHILGQPLSPTCAWASSLNFPTTSHKALGRSQVSPTMIKKQPHYFRPELLGSTSEASGRKYLGSGTPTIIHKFSWIWHRLIHKTEILELLSQSLETLCEISVESTMIYFSTFLPVLVSHCWRV